LSWRVPVGSGLAVRKFPYSWRVLFLFMITRPDPYPSFLGNSCRCGRRGTGAILITKFGILKTYYLYCFTKTYCYAKFRYNLIENRKQNVIEKIVFPLKIPLKGGEIKR